MFSGAYSGVYRYAYVGIGSHLKLLTPFGGATDMAVTEINRKGMATGLALYSSTFRDDPSDYLSQIPHGWIYRGGKIVDAGPASMMALNDAGVVAGSFLVDDQGRPTTGDGKWQAFILKNGVMRRICAFEVHDVLPDGSVLAYNVPKGSEENDAGSRPFIWRAGKVLWLSVGRYMNVDYSKAGQNGDLIGSGQTLDVSRVNNHAILYRRGKIYDLDNLVSSPHPPFLDATEIDRKGRITVDAENGNYLLTPVRSRR